MYTTSAYFNNFDLNSLQGVKIHNYNVSELPTRNLTVSKLARANKSILTSAEYATKNVYLYGFVGGTDIQEVQENYDRMKGRIQDIEGLIRVNQGQGDVEYSGTLNAISKEVLGGPNIKFALEFTCSNPIGRDAAGSTLFAPTVITTTTSTIGFTVEGSFTAVPRITLTINSITGGTNKSVSILNAATQKGMRVTRTWIAGDILKINSDTMEVLVNNVNVDFEGQFPQFIPGPRVIQYIDDFSTRNVTLGGTYTRQYA